MVWTSIGGVRVRGLRYLPRFFRRTFVARKAALAAEGCLGVDLSRHGRLFLAVSYWDDPEAMKSYARTSSHARFMGEDSDLFDFFHNIVVESDAPIERARALAEWEGRFGKNGAKAVWRNRK